MLTIKVATKCESSSRSEGQVWTDIMGVGTHRLDDKTPPKQANRVKLGLYAKSFKQIWTFQKTIHDRNQPISNPLNKDP